MVECLAQPRCRGRVFVLPLLNVPGFVDAPWEALPFPRSKWGWVGGGGGGRELWLVHKMNTSLKSKIRSFTSPSN